MTSWTGASFARMVHERVLNTLHLIALGQVDLPVLAETLAWVDVPVQRAAPARLSDLVPEAVRRSEVPGVHIDLEPDLAAELANASLDRVQAAAVCDAVVEALRNAHRHAGASTISVKAALEGSRARIEIADDGRGIAPDATPRLGLAAGIHEAMASIGGRAEVCSDAGTGTRVLLWLPVPGSSAAAANQTHDVDTQWLKVCVGTRRLLAALVGEEVDANQPEVAHRARVEEGRIRAWLDSRRVHSWLADEAYACVSRAADHGVCIRLTIVGDCGISEPVDADLRGLLGGARLISLMVNPGAEELRALVDAPQLPTALLPQEVQVQVLDGSPAQVRVIRRAATARRCTSTEVETI